ncbi:MAG: hypothetical protein WBO04_12000 [Steroidobacteraceae bacterium]
MTHPTRALGLSIRAWLVLGFAFVIGAFATASVVSLRSTRSATADLAQMQRQFEPLARSVRDLGDGTAAFDRAVLACLRSDTRGKREAAVAAAERLSQAANRTAEAGAAGDLLPVAPLLERITEHQSEGFRLLDLQDRRSRAVAGLERSFDALDRRIKSAGGAGIVVGDSVMARPSISDLARAVEAARRETFGDLSSGTSRAAQSGGGEERLRRTIETHRAEFAASPGRA